MTPQKKAPAWTSADAERARQFLDSETGKRFIQLLSYHRPDYGSFSTIEDRAVKSGIIEGYEKCLLEIEETRASKPE
jgi:hypothetical protein